MPDQRSSGTPAFGRGTARACKLAAPHAVHQTEEGRRRRRALPQPTMSETQADPTSEGLLDAAVTGARWLAAARVASDSVQFVVAIALARMITPAEFGHAAIALILVPLAAILTFEGFGSALVQREHITRAHVETATLTSIAAGLLLTALIYVGAPVVAAPLFGDRTAELLQVASPLFAITGISAVPRSLLWRRLEFRAVSLIEMTTLLFGAILSVVLAAAGLDAEAIVLGAVAGAALATILFLALARPAPPRWHGPELREILDFGGPASAAGLLHVAITNVDYTILAARLSAVQVGFYWRAFQLGVVYQDKISGIMMRLAFPVYSRTRDLDQLRHLHERATRVHAAVVVPILAVGIVVQPALVPWLFGEQWRPAVLPGQILCVAGMVAAVLTGFAQVLLAAGRPKPLFRFNICVLAVYAGAVWVTASHGIVAVAIAVVGVYLGMLVAVYGVLFPRVVGIPTGRMVGDLVPAVAGSCAILALGFPLARMLDDASAPPPVIVAAVCITGFAAHVGVLRTFFPAVWSDLSGFTRRLIPASALPRRRPQTPPVPSTSAP
jgi:O-antigen/teichoic acid export membrane protein